MSTTTQLTQISQAVKAAGGKMPAPVSRAIADRDRAVAAAQAMPAVLHADIIRRATDCLIADIDPLDDPELAKLVLGSSLVSDHGLDRHVGEEAGRRIAQALTEHAPAVTATLCEAAAKAGAVLTQAVAVLNGLDLDEVGAILGLGAPGAESWAAAKRATATISEAEAGWQALADVTRFADARGLRVHRLTDVSLATRAKLGNAPTPWQIVQAGAVVALPADGAELQARVDRHTAERAAEAVASQQSFKDSFRTAHGIPLPR